MKKRLFVLLLIVILVSFGLKLNNSKELNVSGSVEKGLNENNETKTITIKNEANINTYDKFTYKVRARKEKEMQSSWKEIAMLDSRFQPGSSPHYEFGHFESKYYPVKIGNLILSEYTDYDTRSDNLSETQEELRSLATVFDSTDSNVLSTIIDPDVQENAVFSYEWGDEEVTLSKLKNSNIIINDKSYNVWIWGTIDSTIEGNIEAHYNDGYSSWFMLFIYDEKDEVNNYYEKHVVNSMLQTTYLNLTSQLGISPGEEEFYEFTLNSGDSKELSILEGYTIEIEEVPLDGWILESINDNRDITRVEEEVIGDKEYIFKNYSPNMKTITIHHYKDGTTDKLGDDLILNKLVGENYSTEALNIEGYEVITPDNASGVVEDNVEVTYYYKEISEEITPEKEEVTPEESKGNTKPEESKAKERAKTPNTVDTLLIDSEILIISVLVIGICVMFIRRGR